MRSSARDVRITCTLEDTKVVVAGRGTEKSVVRSESRRSCGRKAVEQVGGGYVAPIWIGVSVSARYGYVDMSNFCKT